MADVKSKVHMELREYLQPGGIHQYETLAPKMEEYRKEGCTVYLWGCSGHMVAAGHPDEPDFVSQRPWSNGSGEYFKTAEDCLKLRNGRFLD